ncbi:MAG: hypothetical protein KAU03_06160 [Candidatus Altiarchaeales archaeon]|nr:hypothetical protein [Candidatus Altiarchaeales archaeon]
MHKLVIKVDVKRLRVEDYVNGKKRVCLNKEREIRRTKAGGFAQNKYQRHVDMMKSKTLDWVQSNLLKPGVLRPPYDEIDIVCKDETLKKGIKSVLEGLDSGRDWYPISL